MLKGYDNTGDMYGEVGNTWNLENATMEAYKEKQIWIKDDIHVNSLHKSKVVNEAIRHSFRKSCKYWGKGHKHGQCPAKEQKVQ